MDTWSEGPIHNGSLSVPAETQWTVGEVVRGAGALVIVTGVLVPWVGRPDGDSSSNGVQEFFGHEPTLGRVVLVLAIVAAIAALVSVAKPMLGNISAAVGLLSGAVSLVLLLLEFADYARIVATSMAPDEFGPGWEIKVGIPLSIVGSVVVLAGSIVRLVSSNRSDSHT